MKVLSNSLEQIEDNYLKYINLDYKEVKHKSGEVRRRILVDIVPIILLTAYVVMVHSFFSCFYVLSLIFIINMIFETFYCSIESSESLDVSLLGQRKVELKNYRKGKYPQLISPYPPNLPPLPSANPPPMPSPYNSLLLGLWVIITIVSVTIFIIKIAFLITVLSSPLIDKLEIPSNLLNSLELYVQSSKAVWLDYVWMLLPTTVVLIWSIVVLTQIQKPQPMLFDNFIEKRSENYIVIVKLLTQILLVTVQILKLNLFTYVFFLICLISFFSFLLKKKLRTNVTMIYMKFAIGVGYLMFFGFFLCSTEIISDYEPLKIYISFVGFDSVKAYMQGYSLLLILSLAILMVLNFISLNQLKYKKLRLRILEIRENEVKNAYKQKDSVRESLADQIVQHEKIVQLSQGSKSRTDSIVKIVRLSQGSLNKYQQQDIKISEQGGGVTFIPILQQEGKNSVDQPQQPLKKINSYMFKLQKKFLNLSFSIITILQIGSIIVIQRFNNFYSLLLIFWVIQTGFTKKNKYLVLTSYLFSIPSLVMTYLSLIYRNIDGNYFSLQDNDLTINLNFGFKPTNTFWIDCIILNTMLFLFLFNAKQVQRQTKKQRKIFGVKFGRGGKRKKVPKLDPNDLSKVGWFTILQAFFIKYSYTFALFLLYYVSFQKVTLINLGLVLLFYLFFTNISTVVVKKIRKEGSEEFNCREVEFMSKYWIISVVYVSAIIMSRYILELVRKMVTISDYQNDILDIIGLNIKPNFFLKFSFNEDDFGGLSIMWLLFFFITVQQHVYTSKVYQNYSHRITEVIGAKEIIVKYWDSFPWVCKICSIFYSFGLLWLSFTVIISTLLIFPYSIINTVLLVYALGIIANYILNSKNNKEINFTSFIYQWIVLIVLQISATVIRYILQLSAYRFFQNLLGDDREWWKSFNNNRDIIGLYTQLPYEQMEDLRIMFLPGILIIFFGVMSMSFLSVLSQGQKIVKNKNKIDELQQLKENYKKDNDSRNGSISMSRGSIASMASSQTNKSQDMKKIEENRKQEQYNTYYNFVELDIFHEIPWFEYASNLTSMVITHLNTLVILISAMYFRLALSMLVFIIFYLSYYWFLNNTIFDKIDRHQIIEKTFKKLRAFKAKYVDMGELSSIESDKVNLENIREIELEEIVLRIDIKKKLWVLSFFFSVVCIVLTYVSQILLTRWASENLTEDFILESKWVLFLCGFQVTQNEEKLQIVRQIYFYFVIFWLNVVDLKCTNYLIQKNLELNPEESGIKEINFKISTANEQLQPLQIESLPLNKLSSSLDNKKLDVIGEEFDLEDMQEQQLKLVDNEHLVKYLDQYQITRETQNFNSFIVHDHFTQEKHDTLPNINNLDVQKISDLIKYFDSEKDYVYMKILFGLLRLSERIYVMIMLINSAICTNIFGVFYLLIAVYFWIYKEMKGKGSSTANVRVVSSTSIVIITLQYILLLCSLNQYTSVVVLTQEIQDYKSLSLIDSYLFTCIKKELPCKQWKEYIGFGKQEDGTPVDQQTFIMNSIIVFLIVLFFKFYILIAKTILIKIQKRESWKHKITQRKLLLNFQMWRSKSYVFIHGLYQGTLLKSHTVLTIVILMFSLVNYSLMNLVTLILCVLFIFKSEFDGAQPSSSKKIQVIKQFFTFLLFYQMFIVVLYMFFKVPQVVDIFKDYYFLKTQTTNLSIYGNIFTMFFIQILFDFMNCADYEVIIEDNIELSAVRSKMISRCICYTVNEERLNAQENKVKKDLKLKKKVQAAMDQLSKWHQIISQTTKEQQQVQNDSKKEIINHVQDEQQNELMQILPQQTHPSLKNPFPIKQFSIENLLEEPKKQPILKKIKELVKSGLIGMIKLCQRNKNNFLFLDQANLLNTYLSFSPQLITHASIEIEDFIREKTYKLNRIVEYSFQFYNSFYKELQENDFQPQKNYIKDLTERDNIQKEMKAFLDKDDQYMDHGDAIGIESGCLDRVNLIDSQDYIYLFNIDSKPPTCDNFNFQQLLHLSLHELIELIVSQWHYVCFVAFVLYYFFNPGLMSAPLIIIVFVYFLLTDGITGQSIWTLCYFYISFVIIFQFVLQLNGIDQESEQHNMENLISSPSSEFQVLYYNRVSMSYEVLLFFMIFFQVILLKKMGINKENVMDIENPHMAYFRKKINKTLFCDVTQENLPLKNTRRGTIQSNRSNIQNIQARGSFSDDMGSSQNLADTHKLQRQQDIVAYSIIYNQYEFETQKNRYYMDVTNKSNFFANFTGRHKKKIGLDLYPQIALVQIVILIYTLVRFSQIDQKQSGEATLNLNSFPDSLIILLFVQVVMIVSERFIAFYINRPPIEEDEQEEQFLAQKEQERLQQEKEEQERQEALAFLNVDIEDDAQEDQKKNIYIEEPLLNVKDNQSHSNQHMEENDSSDEQHSDEMQGLVQPKLQPKDILKPSKISIYSKEVFKYCQLVVQILFQTWFVFVYLPQAFQSSSLNDVNSDNQIYLNRNTSYYKVNNYVKFFFFLCAIYFTLSCLQLKIGYTKFKERNRLMENYTIVPYACVKVLFSVPFIAQLKVIMDWTFSNTSLDLFQWFKLEDLALIMYTAKCNAMDRLSLKPGVKIAYILKLTLGWCSVVVILLLIFGPMLLFSNLNPMAVISNVKNMQFIVELQIFQNGPNQQVTNYPLFINDNINDLKIINSSSPQYIDHKETFNSISDIYKAKQGQFQFFNLSYYSASDWQATLPSIDYMKQSINSYLHNNQSKQQFKLQISYQVTRNTSDIISVMNKFSYPFNTYDPKIKNESLQLSIEQIRGILDNLENCASKSVKLPDFSIYLLQLVTASQGNSLSFKPKPYQVLKNRNDKLLFIEDSYLYRQCEGFDSQNQSNSTNPKDYKTYWMLTTNEIVSTTDKPQPLYFYVYSQTYSQNFSGMSLIAIYTTVVLVIGQFLKGFFQGRVEYLVYEEIPYPDTLIDIQLAISVARSENNLKQENIIYYQFIDILRSPEIIKSLTGSYADVQQKRADQIEKNEQEKKNK